MRYNVYMVWLIFLAAVVVLAIVGLGGMKIPHDDSQEGPMVVEAYDRLSRHPLLRLERYLTLRRLARLKPTGTLIDAACGLGYLVKAIDKRFPGLRVVGIDLDEAMLRCARANFPRLAEAFLKGDIAHLPFAEGEIDTVTCTAALHHLPEPWKALAEFYRVLRPGGRLLLFDMRRDTRRVVYWFIILAQFIGPKEIRRANGTVGSFWASHTIPELKAMMGKSGFSQWEVSAGEGWAFVTARK